MVDDSPNSAIETLRTAEKLMKEGRKDPVLSSPVIYLM